jgi:hypothetical protein
VDNNYLDSGMSKSGFIHTLPSGRLTSSSSLKSHLQIHESGYACHTTAFYISRAFHSPTGLLVAWSIKGDW